MVRQLQVLSSRRGNVRGSLSFRFIFGEDEELKMCEDQDGPRGFGPREAARRPVFKEVNTVPAQGVRRGRAGHTRKCIHLNALKLFTNVGGKQDVCAFPATEGEVVCVVKSLTSKE